MKFVAVLVISLSFHTIVSASDHIDGAPSLSNGQADLTDLYSFPSPHKKNNLTVILNSYPGVSKSGHYSSKVKYQIQIRPLSLNTPNEYGLKVQNFDVVNIDCVFTDPDHHFGHANNHPGKVTCQLSKDSQNLTEITGNVGEILENESLKIYTGARSDSFFLSTKHFQGVTQRKGFPDQDKSLKNAMHSINVMSLVIEINFESLNLSPNTIGISAQSLDSKTNVTIDRVGRPEITNLSLHAFEGAKKLKRSYNQKPHFGVSTSFQEVYQKRLYDNISAYDTLDGEQDWEVSDLEKFTHILVNDFLILNLNAPCPLDRNQYLSIEKSLMGFSKEPGCGGRRLTDDIMATLYGIYIRGFESDFANYRTGVNIPYQNSVTAELSNTFPYLAAPSKTTLKQKILLRILMEMQE